MPRISLEGADQVLLLPEPGLPYLRHDRADDITLRPGSVTLHDGLIAALDADEEAHLRFDVSGCAIVPGLVDCHTHLPFAGWREDEYARKVAGASYEEIARAGGGIRRSARQLAAAGDAEVLDQALGLVGEMGAFGTTAFETKTGYGLSPEGELRSLRLGRQLAGRVAQPVVHTALLAHAVPDGHTADSWLDVVEEMLPEVVSAGASALDCYVESIAFTNRHLERVGALAAGAGLHLRAHVEQLATHRSVAPALAARARTLDHLSCLDPGDLAPLAASECACVLLPSAELLGNERAAPGRALADAGAICALATDLNPGTSPVASLPLVIGLAVRRYDWSAREALLAATLNAAWAIGLSGETGSIEPGKRADLVVLDGPVERVAYRLGHNPVVMAFVGGALVHLAPRAEGRMGR